MLDLWNEALFQCAVSAYHPGVTMTRTWFQRLTAAKRRGRFTLRDKELAWSAETCALGERCGGEINRDNFAPRRAMFAGVQFTQAVDNDQVLKAREVP